MSVLSDAAVAVGRALLGKRFSAPLEAFRGAEQLSADELQARQAARLQRIAEHAATTVPFWREAFRHAGLGPHEVTSLEHLRALPVVDKDVFRSRPLADFLSETVPAHRHIPYTTSGSTGDPFRFVLDRAMLPLVFASHLYFDWCFGIDPFDRHVRIMGPQADPTTIPAGTPPIARARYALNGALQAIHHRVTMRRFTTLEVDAAKLRDAFERFRPRYLMSYTSTAAALAEELLRAGWRAPDELKAIITIAEPLTPERRERIETCFRGPVANRYGQREFKFWCAQAPMGDPLRFHLITDLVVAETLREDATPCAPGESGRLVLSNLHNEAMPFLRYDTRDLAVLGPADPTTGRNWPMLERLDGRSQEAFVTPSGRRVDPTTLGQFLFVARAATWVDAIRHYQLVRLADDRVRFRVVHGAGWDEAVHPTRLRHDLAELLGSEVQVELTAVDEIPLERSGKRSIIKLRDDQPR